MRSSGGRAPARPPLTLLLGLSTKDVVETAEISRCTARDLSQLYDLALRTFGAAPGWTRRRVVELLVDDAVFVARESGRPVGYVALSPASDRALLLEQLVVAPGHERLETGNGLLAEAERFARGERAPALRVRVDEHEWTTRSFYRCRGFEPRTSDTLELHLRDSPV